MVFKITRHNRADNTTTVKTEQMLYTATHLSSTQATQLSRNQKRIFELLASLCDSEEGIFSIRGERRSDKRSLSWGRQLYSNFSQSNNSFRNTVFFPRTLCQVLFNKDVVKNIKELAVQMNAICDEMNKTGKQDHVESEIALHTFAKTYNPNLYAEYVIRLSNWHLQRENNFLSQDQREPVGLTAQLLLYTERERFIEEGSDTPYEERKPTSNLTTTPDDLCRLLTADNITAFVTNHKIRPNVVENIAVK